MTAELPRRMMMVLVMMGVMMVTIVVDLSPC